MGNLASMMKIAGKTAGTFKDGPYKGKPKGGGDWRDGPDGKKAGFKKGQMRTADYQAPGGKEHKAWLEKQKKKIKDQKPGKAKPKGPTVKPPKGSKVKEKKDKRQEAWRSRTRTRR